MYVCVLSHAWLFATLRMVARQAPLSMGFSRQEYWRGLPFSPPGDLPNPEVEAVSPALAGRFFTTEPPGKPNITYGISQICLSIKHFFGSQQTILKMLEVKLQDQVLSTKFKYSISSWKSKMLNNNIICIISTHV